MVQEDEGSGSARTRPLEGSESHWGVISGVVGVLGLVLAFPGLVVPARRPHTYGPELDEPGYDDEHAGPRGCSGPLLGVELVQDGRRVALGSRARNGDDVHSIVTATLSTGGFELRLPRGEPQDALAVTVWTDPSVFDLADGQSLEATRSARAAASPSGEDPGYGAGGPAPASETVTSLDRS